MKPRLLDARAWTLLLAAAFLALWCASIGVTYASSSPQAVQPAQESPQEPGALPAAADMQEEETRAMETIGILGWCLVGLGATSVVLSVVLRKPKKRKYPLRMLPRGAQGGGRYRVSAAAVRQPHTTTYLRAPHHRGRK